jgi:hypothetical protein
VHAEGVYLRFAALALLLTARFHVLGAVFGLPAVVRRPMNARIEAINRIYDEVAAT